MKGSLKQIHPDLLRILEDLETHIGFELMVLSGYRTEAKNEAVGGVKHSEHTYDLAEGADVLCTRAVTRFKVIAWLLENGVRRIGIGKEFVHVGIAKDKPLDVLWHYYPEK